MGSSCPSLAGITAPGTAAPPRGMRDDQAEGRGTRTWWGSRRLRHLKTSTLVCAVFVLSFAAMCFSMYTLLDTRPVLSASSDLSTRERDEEEERRALFLDTFASMKLLQQKQQQQQPPPPPQETNARAVAASPNATTMHLRLKNEGHPRKEERKRKQRDETAVVVNGQHQRSKNKNRTAPLLSTSAVESSYVLPSMTDRKKQQQQQQGEPLVPQHLVHHETGTGSMPIMTMKSKDDRIKTETTTGSVVQGGVVRNDSTAEVQRRGHEHVTRERPDPPHLRLPRYAYATVAAFHRPSVLGALVIRAALRKYESRYPLLVIVDEEDVMHAIPTLEACGCTTATNGTTTITATTVAHSLPNNQTSVITPNSPFLDHEHDGDCIIVKQSLSLPGLNGKRLKMKSHNMVKIRVTGMVEWDKIVFLDADTLPIKNLDHLFNYSEHFAISRHNHCNKLSCTQIPQCRSMPNSGLWVGQPSYELMGRITGLVATSPMSGTGDQYYTQQAADDTWVMLPPGYGTFATHHTSECGGSKCASMTVENIHVLHWAAVLKPYDQFGSQLAKLASIQEKDIKECDRKYRMMWLDLFRTEVFPVLQSQNITLNQLYTCQDAKQASISGTC